MPFEALAKNGRAQLTQKLPSAHPNDAKPSRSDPSKLQRRTHPPLAKRPLQSFRKDNPALSVQISAFILQRSKPPSHMHYVYLIRSESNPDQLYTGLTDNLRQRLTEHNAGKSIHTAKHRPWTLETYLAFSNAQQARDFESYLKTASGIAFARKRLRSPV